MSHKSIKFVLVLSVILAMFALSIPTASAAPSADGASCRKTDGGGKKAGMPQYKPGEVIVVWKNGASSAEKASAMSSARIGGTISKSLPEKPQRELCRLKPGISAEDAVESLENDPAVEAAGLNRLKQLQYTPSSPDFVNQWGLNNTGQTIDGQAGIVDADIDAVEAWDIERGNSNTTTVAVIDSGVDLTHPNLSGRLWTNSADPVDGVDNDGNGYVDDNKGYNWAGISQYRVTDAWDFGADTDSQEVAQQFRAEGVNGQCPVSGLEMYFYGKNGSPTQTITYSVRSSIDGADLAVTDPIPASRIAAAGASFVYEPFTTPVNLTPGNDYFFVAKTSAVDAGNYFYIVDHVYANDPYTYDSYLSGSEWWNFDGTWTEFADDDFYFKASGYYYNRDECGHGTHCSGIVGAADSGTGSVGVANGNATRVMALRAGDSSGSLWGYDWMDAIDYAADMGADVISMSFGGTGSDSAEQAVITNAYDDGVALFASSGNSYDSTMQYPVGYDNVIGVGATDNQDNIADFSTYNSSVDISAPGVDYYSTTPTYTFTTGQFGYTQNYSFMSGTSMACPAAAGLGGLLRSRNPELTPSELQNVIERTADDKGTAGRDDYFGYGRINAYQALQSTGNPVPAVTGISPASGNAGGLAFDLTVNGSDFVPGSIVRWNGANRPTTYISSGKLTAQILASDISSPGTADVKVFNPVPGGGTSNAKTFTVTEGDPETWYLAEGTTAWGFDTYISVENPNDETVEIDVTYNTDDGALPGGNYFLAPMSQGTLNPREILGDRDFSTAVTSTGGQPIAVDRTMSWSLPDGTTADGHCSVGVKDANETWYLPEGSTNWGFETWLLIQNPGDTEATVQVTYMIEGEAPVNVEKKVPANSRQSYSMEDDIGAKDASIKVDSNAPVIPERAMYRNDRSEGHDSIGTTTPASDYYLAEGATGYDPNFITYVLIQNPNDTANNVTVTYLTGSGEVTGPAITMDPNSRRTIRVNEDLPLNTDVSTHVHGDSPIIAERAMYWNNGSGEACHDSIGMASAHTTFYLPDGQTSDGRETWTLVSNPNDTDVEVEISYLTSDGTGSRIFSAAIPANSRQTFNMADQGINGRAAVMVTCKSSGKKIMCERAMYWSGRGAGTDTIGGFAD